MKRDEMEHEPEYSACMNERGFSDFGAWLLAGNRLRFFPICKCCGACKPPAISEIDPPLCPDCQLPDSY